MISITLTLPNVLTWILMLLVTVYMVLVIANSVLGFVLTFMTRKKGKGGSTDEK